MDYKRIFFLLPACALLALALFAVACENSAPPSPASRSLQSQSAAAASATSAEAVPVRGDRLLLGSIGEPGNLIPFLSTDTASQEVAGYLFVGLLRYDKDLRIEPWTASASEVLDKGHRLRFTLRDDIYWEDGVQLTVDDVEYTYRVTIDPATPTAYAEDFLAVSSFTRTGPLSFEVRYDKLYSRALVSWMAGIMPKHILEKQDLLTAPFARKPTGAGPFRLKSWDSGRQLTLAASDTYFAGRPHLDEIVYRMIPDLATMFLELKAGRLDSMGLTPQQYLRQTAGDWWLEHWRKHRYLSFSYTYLGYNLAHPLFADVRVRRALTYAIDRQAIIGGVLLGQGEPTAGPFVPGTWAYNDKLKPHPHDPDMARRLLAEAGWIAAGRDGLLHKDGKSFSFTILTKQGNDQRIKAAIIIQSQLRAVGIDVRIRTVEWAAFIKEFVHKG
ncbi:MAG: peptide-binding protein, partial [Deltaproteobacteria bacterium]|nr:peptide-binding protein [Deltaproteobacteria bacterium]